MYQLIKVVVSVFIFSILFSGCGAARLNPKLFSLHESTVQNIEEKNINVRIENIQLLGELPTNKYLDNFIIEEDDIRISLMKNIDKFYGNNTDNKKIYKIDVTMDFKSKSLFGDADVVVDATYNISNGSENIESININSEYIAKFNLTFKSAVGSSLKYATTGTINSGIQNNEELKYEKLEQTSYAEDNTVPLTSIVGFERIRIAYAGAIRLNFAKFLQRFNELINTTH